LYRFDHTAHGQTLIAFPPLGKLVNFLPQIDIADVTCLDDEIIGRREDRESVDFTKYVSWSESFRRSHYNLQGMFGALKSRIPIDSAEVSERFEGGD